MSTGIPGTVISKLIAPPTTYSGVYNSGQFIRFSSGDNPSDLRIHYRTRVMTVAISYDLTGSPNAKLLVRSNSNAGTYFLCPSNLYYSADPLYTFANMFSKWKMEGVCFEFVPRVSGGTGTGIYVTWGWSNDPVFPDSHGWNYLVGFGWQPTEAQVATLANAKQFPAWVPQECLRIKSDEKKWLSTVAADFNTAVSGADVVSDVRSQYSGMLCMGGNENSVSTASAGTTVTVGNIYIEGTFQFSELSTGNVVDPSTTKKSKAADLVEKLKSADIDPETLSELLSVYKSKSVLPELESKRSVTPKR
jgi:hypothetical protein